jgi:steroid 5-alpha reductase family enzyme
MENIKPVKGGVNREHGSSMAEKVTFSVGHLTIIIICFWLVYGNGWEIVGQGFNKNWHLADPKRAQILVWCAAIYWFRHALTLFYLLTRRVYWSEVLGLLGSMAFFEIGLVLIGGGAFRNDSIDLNLLDSVALALYLFGSYLNTFSEIQRKRWKANPANKGHCYTEGLFRYSMHINYFGDTVLFTGWCLFTQNIWIMIFPLLIGLSFVFYHIPALDSYLAERYGEEFKTYAQKTKKFIPFLY